MNDQDLQDLYIISALIYQAKNRLLGRANEKQIHYRLDLALEIANRLIKQNS